MKALFRPSFSLTEHLRGRKQQQQRRQQHRPQQLLATNRSYEETQQGLYQRFNSNRNRILRAAQSDFTTTNDDDSTSPKMYDFCLTLPWGTIVALSGVAGFLFKRSVPSLVSGGLLGSLLLYSGMMSLTEWKNQQPTRKYTAISLLVTLVLLAIMGPKYFLRGGNFFPSGMLAYASCFCALYYVWNLFLAGGNAGIGGTYTSKKMK